MYLMHQLCMQLINRARITAAPMAGKEYGHLEMKVPLKHLANQFELMITANA